MSPRTGRFQRLGPASIRRPIARLALEARWHWLSTGVARPLPASAIQPGPLVVSAFYNEVLGVGRAGRLTAGWLENVGLPVVRHDLRPGLVHQLHGGLPFPVKENGGVWLIHGNPPEAKSAMLAHKSDGWRRRYRIGYWAWETSEAPADWAETVPYFHEVWVPSTFVAEALKCALHNRQRPSSGALIRVVPHALPDLSGLKADRARFGIRDDEVATLSAVDLRSTAARKNPWGSVEAWSLAFPRPQAGRRLILKLIGGTADRDALARLHAAAASRPDITLMDTHLSDGEMGGLVASVDIVLSPHRAEGFGLVLAEAMALGKAVVATGYSGNMDFMDANSAALVPYTLRTADDPSGRYRGVWAEPDLQRCAELLKVLVEDPSRRRALGVAAQRRIADLGKAWSASTLAEQSWVSFVAPCS